ncbi:MAG: DUF2723 domain-containing protein [Caldilineaceae bacterium]
MYLPPFIQQAQTHSKRYPMQWAGFLLIVAALCLYLATLDNGLQPGELVGGDLITHQYAQVQARPSNAPGYPLYTMGGWAWFHGLRTVVRAWGKPLPNPIPLLSSYSLLWALLALWLFYRILCFCTRSPAHPTGNWPLAWLISAFYAVTYFFWYYATTTEQYSSAVAQTLAIVYVYLLWAEEEAEGREQGGGGWANTAPPATHYLLLLAFLCGLSLAHMLTVAFIVPPVVALVLWQAPELLRSPRMVLGAVLAAFAPLLSYSYVYWRGALHPEWWGAGHWSTAQDWFWAFLSTAQGREELSRGFAPGRAFWGGGFPELMWQELSIPLFVLGLFGIIRLGRKLAFLLYGTLVIYLVFCWGYRYGNWFQVILPAYPLLLLGVAAVGHAWQEQWSREQGAGGKGQGFFRTRRPSFTMYYLPLLLLTVAIVWRFETSLPRANSHNRPGDTALDHAALLLAQPLPKGAAVFAPVDDALALQYLIALWQIRPDLQVVSSNVAAQWLAQGQPVFATWPAAPTLQAELPATLKCSMQSAGADWIVFQTGGRLLLQTPQVKFVQTITPDVRLMGYQIRPGPSAEPVTKTVEATMDVTLFWRIHGPDWPNGLSISVRPTRQGAMLPNPAGGVIQQDNARPAHGLLTLATWPADQPIADAYRLPLPAHLPTGADGVTVILYRSKGNGFENVAEIHLPMDATEGNVKRTTP